VSYLWLPSHCECKHTACASSSSAGSSSHLRAALSPTVLCGHQFPVSKCRLGLNGANLGCRRCWAVNEPCFPGDTITILQQSGMQHIRLGRAVADRTLGLMVTHVTAGAGRPHSIAVWAPVFTTTMCLLSWHTSSSADRPPPARLNLYPPPPPPASPKARQEFSF
jgi:hypothetical protein